MAWRLTASTAALCRAGTVKLSCQPHARTQSSVPAYTNAQTPHPLPDPSMICTCTLSSRMHLYLYRLDARPQVPHFIIALDGMAADRVHRPLQRGQVHHQVPTHLRAYMRMGSVVTQLRVR